MLKLWLTASSSWLEIEQTHPFRGRDSAERSSTLLNPGRQLDSRLRLRQRPPAMDAPPTGPQKRTGWGHQPACEPSSRRSSRRFRHSGNRTRSCVDNSPSWPLSWSACGSELAAAAATPPNRPPATTLDVAGTPGPQRRVRGGPAGPAATAFWPVAPVEGEGWNDRLTHVAARVPADPPGIRGDRTI